MYLSVVNPLLKSGSEFEVDGVISIGELRTLRSNKRSFYGHLRELVLICMSWELSYVLWNNS